VIEAVICDDVKPRVIALKGKMAQAQFTHLERNAYTDIQSVLPTHHLNAAISQVDSAQSGFHEKREKRGHRTVDATY